MARKSAKTTDAPAQIKKPTKKPMKKFVKKKKKAKSKSRIIPRKSKMAGTRIQSSLCDGGRYGDKVGMVVTWKGLPATCKTQSNGVYRWTSSRGDLLHAVYKKRK